MLSKLGADARLSPKRSNKAPTAVDFFVEYIVPARRFRFQILHPAKDPSLTSILQRF